ncbi:MAG: hypothetical protein HY321_21440 [Armatimonadetes bacterium]|nr:hypothetical protein [Armatimonadota bacterium]
MRFGVSVKNIVPPFRTCMGGYGGRRDYFDGVNDPITFTAIVIEEGGKRALLSGADLCHFPDDGSTGPLLDAVGAAVGCPRDSVILNASHTHGGPRVPGANAYYRNRYDTRASGRFGVWLGEQVLAGAREAAENLQEGTLWYGERKTTLPMNRRLFRDGRVHNAPNPDGPVDDRLQILAFRNAAGELSAVAMKGSAHPVATGAQHLLTADYPGAWRAEFSRAFGPSVTPLFLQGAGADARPRRVADGDRWTGMRHDQLHVIGEDLMAECLRVLTGTALREIRNLAIEGRIATVKAPCERRYTRREQFEEMLKGGSEAMLDYAHDGLRAFDEGRGVPDRATYQVQTIRVSPELALITIDAEVLCGLGAKVEAALAPAQTILLGCTNGYVEYVADSEELARGGYEASSYLFQGWTGPLLPGVEHLMAEAVRRTEVTDTANRE